MNSKTFWNMELITMNIEIIGISDSDHTKDKEARRNVTGYNVSVNGAIVSTKSKMQESVTL
jgi:hypothetical protein